ncbi:hypothetical protein MMIC_P0426 [Mariprofundus micogutta]|uniref:Porin n=1 Tax=Mariprofundus micogutta TaxID=1921010 RepID=A0A1L8CKR0_9PROT|nr:hypothetical protein [Mariprofundus micogutta]GAV19492.1 hypothetical protein MMIC_P0426 [Mariprofundus micogutta]
MKATIRTIAALATMAFATPAIAGGVSVYDDGESKLKIEALIYANSFYQTDDRVTTGTSVKTKTTGTHIDRAYFTAKYYFNNDWMMRLTTDMGNEAALGKDQNIYLKYAYVEGKLAGKAAVMRLGQSHTPWIDYEQGLWKHRYVAKVMSDTYKFDTSADLGFGLKGKLADGMVDYFVTATNGTGYGKGNPTSGTEAGQYGARVGIHPIKGLDIDFGFNSGYKGTRKNINNVKTLGVKSDLTQAMISYGTKEFRLGANYMVNKDKAKSATASSSHGGNTSSGFTTALAGDEVKSTGYAVWGWAKIPGTQIGAFGRFENLKNQKTSGGVVTPTKEKIDRFVAGLEYSPIKNITFAAVVDSSKLKNRGGNSAVTDKDFRWGLYSQIKL